MAEPSREVTPRQKAQTKGSTELQGNFLSHGEGVSDLEQRNSKSGFSDAQRHPVVPFCPGTGRSSQQHLTLCCLGGDAGNAEQTGSSTGSSTGDGTQKVPPLLVAWQPASHRSHLVCKPLAVEATWYPPVFPFPLQHRSLAVPGPCSAAIYPCTPSAPMPPALPRAQGL